MAETEGPSLLNEQPCTAPYSKDVPNAYKSSSFNGTSLCLATVKICLWWSSGGGAGRYTEAPNLSMSSDQ